MKTGFITRFFAKDVESNIKEYGWHIHVDNSDFETIANGDIEYIEQVEVFMNLYKNY